MLFTHLKRDSFVTVINQEGNAITPCTHSINRLLGFAYQQAQHVTVADTGRWLDSWTST